MKSRPPISLPTYVLVASLSSLALLTSARSQADSPKDAQLILQQVKQREAERQQAAKQTELERLNQDLQRGQKESETVQQSIASMQGAIGQTSSQLDQLGSEKNRLSQELEVTTLRIDAERQKVEGLRLLSEAQSRSLEALEKRNNETELRASIGAAELKIMSPPPTDPENTDLKNPEPRSKLWSEIAELKKKLAKSELATLAAQKTAREATRAASSKLQLADIAATKAKKRAVDLGVEAAPVASGERESAERASVAPKE